MKKYILFFVLFSASVCLHAQAEKHAKMTPSLSKTGELKVGEIVTLKLTVTPDAGLHVAAGF